MGALVPSGVPPTALLISSAIVITVATLSVPLVGGAPAIRIRATSVPRTTIGVKGAPGVTAVWITVVPSVVPAWIVGVGTIGVITSTSITTTSNEYSSSKAP